MKAHTSTFSRLKRSNISEDKSPIVKKRVSDETKMKVTLFGWKAGYWPAGRKWQELGGWQLRGISNGSFPPLFDSSGPAGGDHRKMEKRDVTWQKYKQPGNWGTRTPMRFFGSSYNQSFRFAALHKYSKSPLVLLINRNVDNAREQLSSNSVNDKNMGTRWLTFREMSLFCELPVSRRRGPRGGRVGCGHPWGLQTGLYSSGQPGGEQLVLCRVHLL